MDDIVSEEPVLIGTGESIQKWDFVRGISKKVTEKEERMRQPVIDCCVRSFYGGSYLAMQPKVILSKFYVLLTIY